MRRTSRNQQQSNLTNNNIKTNQCVAPQRCANDNTAPHTGSFQNKRPARAFHPRSALGYTHLEIYRVLVMLLTPTDPSIPRLATSSASPQELQVVRHGRAVLLMAVICWRGILDRSSQLFAFCVMRLIFRTRQDDVPFGLRAHLKIHDCVGDHGNIARRPPVLTSCVIGFE